jgi:RNA polymerase sigma factor (sigma-70 family)
VVSSMSDLSLSPSSGSVSEWIGHLKAGEADAARKLWERYADQIALLARQQLAGRPTVVSDEDDVAQSVFYSICRGATAGRFRDIKSRGELWWLLLAITRQKAINHFRRQSALKRGPGRVETETALAKNQSFNLDDLVGSAPTPELMLILEEEYAALLASLNDRQLQQIAVLRVEGYTVPEIAEKFGIGTRAIERKLHLIRSIWAGSFPNQS